MRQLKITRKILKTRCNVKKSLPYQLFSCLLFLVGKQPHWEKKVLAQTGPKHRSYAINRYTGESVYGMNISKSRHKLHSHLPSKAATFPSSEAPLFLAPSGTGRFQRVRPQKMTYRCSHPLPLVPTEIHLWYPKILRHLWEIFCLFIVIPNR